MEKQIKVVIMLGSLNRGGVETMILDSFYQSWPADIKLTCIYRHGGSLTSDYINTGIPITKISPGKIWMIFYYLKQLKKFFKTQEINIIHSHQSLDTIFSWLASRTLNIKIIQTIHSFDYEGGFINKIFKRISIRLTDKLIFVSQFQKEYYQKEYLIHHEKLKVVYNGIDFRKFKNCTTLNIRDTLGLKDKKLLLGMVGNFSPGRDHMTICRFLFLLKNEHIQFFFLFIGSKNKSYPYLYDECVDFCKKNGLTDEVLFCGEWNDVPSLLPQLDAFIFSTIHDTFGISVIEAIAAGIPVFANDWDVIKEITESGERAVLYRSYDEKDLLEIIMNFYVQPEQIRLKAKENAVWVRSQYNIQQHISQLHQIYSTV